ncbi:MAG: putative ATPase [Candidatus Peribacteria bacterium]|nr:putative ATPase [Candidatus Peribacteria bacterium]
MRPTKLDDFIGQEHVVGQGSPLRTLIEKDALTSLILSGPPGTGKTSLARIIAEITSANFVQLNAVTSGVKDIKEVCEAAEKAQLSIQPRTVLFVDEIHRFNKSQQDALLPYVESGVITLIGATTQNPYFEVNQALLSRSQIYLLKPLSEEDLFRILQHALTDFRGYNGMVTISKEALRHIAHISNGDARIALNSLELTVLTVGQKISIKQAEEVLRQRRRRYDKNGEDHYNVISAFIKSMRGSDPDAALLWLFMMIQAGEEPRFLFRRMAIFASEDIGNADPRALQVVVSAWQAFELVGLPEGEFFLSHACVYISQAPKSNAVTKAMHGVKEAISAAPSLEVPNHLRNAPIKGMAEQGYGKGYDYPHNSKDGVVAAHYFPVGVPHQQFYEPTDRGFEAEVRQRLIAVRSTLLKQNEQ